MMFSAIVKKTPICRALGTVRREVSYRRIDTLHRLSASLSKRSGVTEHKRRPELVVSLTSIPERISKVHLCIDSLLRQSVKPDRLILWLSECDDLQRPLLRKDTLPKSLLRLERRGLEIRWCKDVSSYRKIIPTLAAYPEALIVTADDDLLYPKDWLGKLHEAHQREPQYIHCHRAHLMRYDDRGKLLPYRQWDFESPGFQGPSLRLFPTTGHGVLYAPGHLSLEVLHEAAFLSLCPKADDVWMKAMSLLNNVLCSKISRNLVRFVSIRIGNNRTLASYNVSHNGNDSQIDATFSRYRISGKPTSL